MDNPANEIVNVAKLVTAAVNPDIQYDAVMRCASIQTCLHK